MESSITKILNSCNYPTDIICLDFETFFDSQYCMGTGKLSTVEYVSNKQFDFLGLAYCKNMGEIKYITPNELLKFSENIKNWCNNYTLVAHNFSFDGLLLAEKFGCCPKYCVDTIGLSRYFEARAKHSLAECAKRYSLKPKGVLDSIKTKHWKDLTPPLRRQLISYAKNDVEITSQLFEIMLPMLPRPEKELLVMQDLLERFWVPQLEFDFDKAEELRSNMEDQITHKLEELTWL